MLTNASSARGSIPKGAFSGNLRSVFVNKNCDLSPFVAPLVAILQITFALFLREICRLQRFVRFMFCISRCIQNIESVATRSVLRRFCCWRFLSMAPKRKVRISAVLPCHCIVVPLSLMVCSLPNGQFVFSSCPVVKTVRYFRPLV